MARKVADREDLLRDGTQMPIRGLTSIEENEVFVGFRKDRQVSIYWNQDPVFQFNAAHQLRRVYYRDVRYTADQGRLCELVASPRQASQDVSRLQLQTQPILEELQSRILDEFAAIRTKLQGRALRDWKVAGDLSSLEFAEAVQNWLNQLPEMIAIANQPNA